MNEFKGTPGPWFDGSTSMKRYDVTAQDGRMVARIEANDEIDDFNCMLIAAAPELLEALKACLPWVNNGIARGAHVKAQAAISKALGETK